MVKGWFNETIPIFLRNNPNPRIAFIHVDCDIYSSTKTVFEMLHPFFENSIVIVFDELINYPNYENHEIKAFYEFLRSHPEWTVEWIGCKVPFEYRCLRDNGADKQSVACRLIKNSL